MRHVMESANPDEHLLKQVLSRFNLQQAWKRVRGNKGSVGIDGMSVMEFTMVAKTQWIDIRHALFNDIFLPSPVLRVEIPKPSGGIRPLGIPTVTDRLIQQAIFSCIEWPVRFRINGCCA